MDISHTTTNTHTNKQIEMIIAATIDDENKQTLTAIVDTTMNALFDHNTQTTLHRFV